ncbi:MAG: trypsin-like serine protease [Armatimonadetes bacterium]|nr:trypsin-like serine protease [Armatimonadota bacterium]
MKTTLETTLVLSALLALTSVASAQSSPSVKGPLRPSVMGPSNAPVSQPEAWSFDIQARISTRFSDTCGSDPSTRTTSFGTLHKGFRTSDDAGGADRGTGNEQTIQDVFGSDDRTEVSSTTSFPNSARCRIVSTFRDGYTVSGSGNLIDKNDVLTACHVVYDGSHGGFATNVRVYPGQDGTTLPFGSASGTNVLYWSDFTSKGNYDHDMAVVRLSSNIGSLTGWYGFASVSDNEGAGATIGGYPGDKPYGTQWYDSDPIQIQTTNRLYYWIDTESGDSGAGVYRFIGGDRYIVAAHSGWNTYWTKKYNRGTRITSSKFASIDAYVH